MQNHTTSFVTARSQSFNMEEKTLRSFLILLLIFYASFPESEDFMLNTWGEKCFLC